MLPLAAHFLLSLNLTQDIEGSYKKPSQGILRDKMNVQDITGKVGSVGPIAGVKSKVISDGHAPWAHGGEYEWDG